MILTVNLTNCKDAIFKPSTVLHIVQTNINQTLLFLSTSSEEKLHIFLLGAALVPVFICKLDVQRCKDLIQYDDQEFFCM